ncbi:Nitroreductase-like protein [Aspergillus karnatakaensis]|uniref:nitroreductase family protein n=1 Tax=Aspergillus karnatakaensis TaxID=1810916 RepID=UPI003CCCA409
MSASRIASRILSPVRSSICRHGIRTAIPAMTPTIRPFSVSARKQDANTSPKTDVLVELAQSRRTIYQLGNKSPVPDSKIEELVNSAILNVPSAFNTQSTRLLVLLHHEHERLWDVVIDVFQNLVKTGAIPEQVWQKQTLPKLQGFKAGVGTILFYEDPAHILPFSEKFALYKDQFQPWADHSNAMHQYFLWTGLESLGFGANLQHYNPLIDAPVAKRWNIPADWRLVSQLVFGSPEGSPGEKTQKPIEDRVKIYGKE